MTTMMLAPTSLTKGQKRWVAFMATIGGWLLSNLTVLATVLWVMPGNAEERGFTLLFFVATLGLIPWIPFLALYLPLTLFLRERWGGWNMTQFMVTIITWAGGIGLLYLLLNVYALWEQYI